MRLKSDLTLLLVAMVWGSGFVAQRAAAHYLNAFFFNGSRFLLAALLLLVLIRFRWTLPRQSLWKVGLTGMLLFVGAGLQQAGLATTAIGNASFITGLYVILVPVILSLFVRHKIGWLTWCTALLAVAGVGLLSLTASFKLSPGDSLELAGAFIWSFHVILVGHFSRQMDVLQFSIGQFVVCGLLNLGVALASNLAAVEGIAGCALMLAAMILSQLKGGLPEGETPPVSIEIGTGS